MPNLSGLQLDDHQMNTIENPIFSLWKGGKKALSPHETHQDF